MKQHNDKFGKPLSFYKQEIDLFEFMKVHGYTQMGSDKEKSSRNHRRITNPLTGEKFIVKMNANNEFTYYSHQDTSIKGSTVIDFVQHHYSQERPNETFHLGKVRQILDDYLQGKLTQGVIPKLSPQAHASKAFLNSHVSPSLSDDVLKEVYCVKELFNTKFLTDFRHIDPSVLNSTAFKGRVFNSVYEMDNQKIINTAFLFINRDNKVCGLSVRNKTADKSYKRIFEGKQGLVCSNDLASLPTLKNSPPTFIVCESFIDAMSHYELNKDWLDKTNFRYFSTEGTPSEAQVSLFDQLVSHYKPEQFHFAYDNDKGGYMLSTFLMCDLNKNTVNQLLDTSAEHHFYTNVVLPDNTVFKSELFTDFDKESKAEYFGQILVTFNTDNAIQTSELCAKFNEYFQDFNTHQISEFGDKHGFSLSFKEIDKQAKIVLTFKNSKECWQGAFSLIHDLRFNKSLKIQRDKPLLNDFNEDLQLHKNKHPKYVLKQEEGLKSLVMRDNPEKKAGLKTDIV